MAEATAPSPRIVSRTKAHGGWLYKVAHESTSTDCTMHFCVYIPPVDAGTATPFPAVYFLSGLTCNEDNFVQKSGALAHAARLKLALVAPDTSPRGTATPGEDDGWDFGTGAGFYVDAVAEPWSRHYRMYSYITEELPRVIASLPDQLPIDSERVSLMGHSMGGHGALTLFLRQAHRYKSVSAFAPICHPSACAWGKKAFEGYFGPDKMALWHQHDATELAATFTAPTPREILIDQGGSDKFLADGQLQPDAFVRAAAENAVNIRLTYRLHDDYDHSYYFIATFIGEHLVFHARHLGRH